jgi:hypothetical protein
VGIVVWRIVGLGGDVVNCTDCNKASGLGGMTQATRSTDPTIQVGDILCKHCQDTRARRAEGSSAASR